MPTLTKDEIVEAIASLSVLDLAELSKALQDKFGVTPTVAVAAGPAAAPAGGAPTTTEAQPEAPTSFDVILTAAGEKRLGVIKVVREVTGQGLKESKDLVEGVPSKIKEGLNKEDAEALKAKFEAEGATIEIKPAG